MGIINSASRLKGITVFLYDKVQTGKDNINRPIYEEEAVQVENVLIGEPDAEAIADELNLSGKRLVYTLAIPKEDDHVWTDKKISFFGQTFRSFGEVTQGIESMIPLNWNKKVKVERYE